MTCKVNADTTNGLKLTSDTSGEIDLQTNGTTKVHMDSSGNVGIGTSSPSGALQIGGTDSTLISGEGTGDRDFSTNTFSTIDIPSFSLMNQVGATYKNISGLGMNFTNGVLGIVNNYQYTGGGKIAFYTGDKTSTTGNLTERMRLTSAGRLGIGTTAPGNPLSVIGDAIAPAKIVRNTNDGGLVLFVQAGVTEGTITVSGSTVSYNGGHLSRWGRLPDGSQPTILKGTVMSNLDEMVVWEVDGVEAENEQRNQLKISDVEGDINVAGLFVKWDTEEDGYNDIDLAMTGDMVIRIAQGTTVQRGDLLMSAGDGTAKPQGDDIVRSKTIAKVTSTTVINTYDDGSYVVPCVVMAC